jgi:hypothetical protein
MMIAVGLDVEFLLNYFTGMIDTIFTDMTLLAGYQYLDFFPVSATEGTMQCRFGHVILLEARM